MKTAMTSTDAHHHVLVGGFEIQQRHAGLQRLHHQGAEHGAIDGAKAAGQRRAANNGGGNDIEFVELAQRVGGRVEAGRGDAGGNGGKAAHQREDHDRQALGVDTGQFGCFRIAAGCIDIAAKAGAGGKECHQRANADGDQNRHGVAVAEMNNPSGGNGDGILHDITVDHALWARDRS